MSAQAARHSPSTVCVFLGGALGDFLLALPALQALRRACPAARIDLAGNATWLALALRSGAVNRTLSLETLALHAGFRESLPADHTLKRFLSTYDLILSWFGDREGRWESTLRQAGAGEVYVFPFHRRTDFQGHVSGYFLDTLRRAGLNPQQADAGAGWPADRLWSPERIRPLLREQVSGKTEPGICIHPGSGSPAKNWPQDRFREVAQEASRRWSLPVQVLLGEAEEAQRVFWKQAESSWLRPRSGLDLLQVSDILLRALLYLGNDSGISHLAGSLGVPTLTLFGPTDPDRWAPLGPRVRVLRRRVHPTADLGYRDGLPHLDTGEVLEVLADTLAHEFPKLRESLGPAAGAS